MEWREGYRGDIGEGYETDAEARGWNFGFGFRKNVAASTATLGAFRAEETGYWAEGVDESGWW